MSHQGSISVRDLGKRYRLGRVRGYRTLRSQIAEAFPRLGRRQEATPTDPNSRSEVWALRNVSFDVAGGEVLGVIGPNGAGKSTLLKLLSRITEPTEGRATIRGRVGSLLEVGTGFHPELTGRENVFLYGAILGMTRSEIERRFEEMVRFSNVERFLDTPVKRFSTGMRVRLAFSVAAHLEPEVFLVDEVLAVGDAAFQQKCLGKMGEVAQASRTVLFVSHNMGMIRSICTRAIVVDRGGVRFDGDVDEAVDYYLASVGRAAEQAGPGPRERTDRAGHGGVRVVACDVVGDKTLPTTGSPVDVRLTVQSQSGATITKLHVVMAVVDEFGQSVFACNSTMRADRDFHDVASGSVVVCRIPKLPLIPGRYAVNLHLKDDHGHADVLDRAAVFMVHDRGAQEGIHFFPDRRYGNVLVGHDWFLQPPTDRPPGGPGASG